jgi:hypothetical protein
MRLHHAGLAEVHKHRPQPDIEKVGHWARSNYAAAAQRVAQVRS